MSIKKVTKKLFASLLAIALIVSSVPSSVHAADTINVSSSKKMYALEITTGSVGTDIANVQSIVITYTSNNKTQIYSQNMRDSNGESILSQSLEYAMSMDGINTITADQKAWIDAYGSAFLKYETQTFFFMPYDNIDSVESINIITTNSGSWDIQGMRLIEITTDNNAISTVSYSEGTSMLRPSYRGTRMLEMSGDFGLQWASGKVFTISDDSDADAYIENVKDSFSTYNSAGEDDLWIQMNIADEYMAGLESLDVSGRNAVATDLLTATFYYVDTYGDTHGVSVPVISGLNKEYADTDARNNTVNAFAQQGNTLMVQCRLPKFDSLITDSNSGNSGVKITLGYDETSALCYKNNAASADNTTVSEKASELNDSMAITDIAFYKDLEVNVTPSVSNGELGFDISSSSNGDAVPVCYYHNKLSSGRQVSYGDTLSFPMTDNSSSRNTLPENKSDVSNLYLVQITTDNFEAAESTGDVSIKFNYTTYGSTSSVVTDDSDTNQNTTVASETYSVKDKVTEFYGYWSGSGTNPENYAYYSGMKANGKLTFLVSLANVDTFKSVQLSISGGEEWQIQNVSIARVTGTKHRTITVGQSAAVAVGNVDISVDHLINREVTSVQLTSSNSSVLIPAGGSKDIEFSESQSVVEDTDSTSQTWDTTKKELSYKEACSDLGFNVSKVTYNVDVTVAGSSASDATNGDSGSKNLFYFKLNFENGSSAYVLANQQLSSDGFRTGQTERFSIAMNQNYGELVSVDIIPDDTSSSSDIYDKLNIEEITVTQQGTSAVSRSWSITSPGWVGVNYKEEGQSNSTDNTGRYEGELVRSYSVNKYSYNVKLMFVITTGEYDKGVQQFSGSVQATLRYTNSANESKSISFDMVEQMYSYMQMSSTKEGGVCKSNTARMFRGGSVDRFFLDLPDVQSVDSLTLSVCDDNGSTWKINSVAVRQVSSLGDMILNDKGEYEYTGKMENLTTQDNDNTPAYSVTAAQGTKTDVRINFGENKINIDTSDAGNYPTATITRRPEGTNDTLNIFVKPKSDDGVSLDNYTVSTDFFYNNAYGTTFQNGISSLRYNGEYYYVLGVSASSFVRMKQLKAVATANNGVSTKLYGDGIIIQHVRSGTLIGTYLLNNKNADLSLAHYYSAATEVTNQETQTVSLYFGSSTTNQALTDAGKNVAVSIGFKSSLADDDQVYHSPYVYLTDEQYNNLTSNLMAEIDFHIPYVREITDIRIAGIDDVEGVIESATVGTYTNDSSVDLTKPDINASNNAWSTYEQELKKAYNARTLTGWYSFLINSNISNVAQTFSPTNTDTVAAGSLVPATLTLTADETSMNSDVDLSVTITYISENGDNEIVRRIPSVKAWIGDTSTFTAGSSIDLSMMLSDVKAITGIHVQTVGTGTVYPLAKAVIEYNRYGETKTISKTVGKQITTQGYDISLVSGSLVVSATSHPADENEQGITLPTATNTDMNFALTKGDTLTVNAAYSSNVTSEPVTYTLYKKESSGAIASVNNAVTVNGYTYTIATAGLEAGDYELHIIASKTKEEAVVKFTVKVKTAAQSTTEAATESTTSTTQQSTTQESTSHSTTAN